MSVSEPATPATASSRPVTNPPGAVPPGTNLVVLRGSLSRDPEPRELPSGSVVVAFEVTVRPEAAAADGARAESVPVTWADPPAAALRLEAGVEVVVVGRVRRRFFRAGGATASRTEVVAARIVPARHTRRVAAAVGAAAAVLAEGPHPGR